MKKGLVPPEIEAIESSIAKFPGVPLTIRLPLFLVFRLNNGTLMEP